MRIFCHPSFEKPTLPITIRSRGWLQFVRVILSGTIVFLSACDDEEELALGNEVREMSVVLEGLKKKLGELADESNRDREKIAKLEGDIRNLQQYQRLELDVAKQYNDAKTYETDLKASVGYLEERISVWKDAVRTSLAGMALGSVPLGNGTVLADARVVQILDGSVNIQYRGGEASFLVADLPESLREQFVDESLIVQKLRIEKEKQ